MNRFAWLPDYLARLETEHILVRAGNAERLSPAHALLLDAEDWRSAARVAATLDSRLVAVWGDPGESQITVRACFVFSGDYLVLETVVPLSQPQLLSLTPLFPAADRLERHARDMLGLEFLEHPDARRWTRHQAWPEKTYPLRVDFPISGDHPRRTPPDSDYPFERVLGNGVYEIPVGPVHAGIIEPGHFRFQAVGEEVLRLEERLGYVHKGIEKIAVGRDAKALARLAGRVSGDSTVAHTWAACQAMERATHCEVPARALFLRALMAERERVANHLGDIGAICNDVGFSFVHTQCAKWRELWQRRSQALFGHRFMMDAVTPGGVASDLTADAIAELRGVHAQLNKALQPVFEIIEDHPSLDDRLLGTGRLDPKVARRLGTLGYVGKASGEGYDVRRHSAYAPYQQLVVEVPVYKEGDVAARTRVRMTEIRISLELMDQLLELMPQGPYATDLPAARKNAQGVGFVEGFRGEIMTYVRFDAQGHIARFFPRDPSWLNWPALEILIQDNIVPDFPVCNKSVNGSYSGHDL